MSHVNATIAFASDKDAQRVSAWLQKEGGFDCRAEGNDVVIVLPWRTPRDRVSCDAWMLIDRMPLPRPCRAPWKSSRVARTQEG